jgi:hypothetical protein
MEFKMIEKKKTGRKLLPIAVKVIVFSTLALALAVPFLAFV